MPFFPRRRTSAISLPLAGLIALPSAKKIKKRVSVKQIGEARAVAASLMLFNAQQMKQTDIKADNDTQIERNRVKIS